MDSIELPRENWYIRNWKISFKNTCMKTVSLSECDPIICATALEQLISVPPHGPFLWIAALAVRDVIAERHQVSVSLTDALQFIRAHYNPTHMQSYSSFYSVLGGSDSHLTSGYWKPDAELRLE